MFLPAASESAVLTRNLGPWDWAGAAAVLALGVLLGWGARKALSRNLKRSDSDAAASDTVARLASYLIGAAAFILALSYLGVRAAPLIGALGIGGLAVAIAAQSILANFLASVILQLRRPFRRHDEISTNDCEGVVLEVNFRTVVLRTFEGERLHVPCAEVLANPITNYSALGQRRTTLEIGVAYDTDLTRVQQLLLDAVSGVEEVLPHPEPEVWVQAFGGSSIDLAVRYWHRPPIAVLWRVRSRVAVAVKAALDEAGIEIPFPHTVVQLHRTDEGPNGRAHAEEGYQTH